MLNLQLGTGDKLISDIYDPEGQWAGVMIRQGISTLQVGQDFNDPDGTLVKEVEDDILVAIRTSNPDSLDVLIGACERAKAKLAESL